MRRLYLVIIIALCLLQSASGMMLITGRRPQAVSPEAVTGFTASGDYLWHNATVVTTYPFILSAWGYVGTTISTYTAAISGTNSQAQRRGQCRISAATNVNAAVNDGTFVQDAITGVPIGSWFHMCCAFTSTASREAYLNGTASGSPETTSVNPSAATRFVIGVRNDQTSEAWTDGALAEISVWDATALSEANRDTLCADLANGENPININAEAAHPFFGMAIAYWPLNGVTDLADAIGSFDLTKVGAITSFSGHPTIDPAP